MTLTPIWSYTHNMTTTTIPVIYQDHHLLIVNKPAGLVIHPTYKNVDGTMWNALLADLAQLSADDWRPPVLPDEPGWAGAPPHIQSMLRQKRIEKQWKEDGLLPRPCLLHRLDKDTSGIVALARTERSRRHLVRQFQDVAPKGACIKNVSSLLLKMKNLCWMVLYNEILMIVVALLSARRVKLRKPW
ncbi:MAG: hypothetical protein E6J11_20625 [Chloroflexi bacterium]|nr:MAG: hypothetical protein E6J11_20625 [Chloroflexota bacterium]